QQAPSHVHTHAQMSRPGGSMDAMMGDDRRGRKFRRGRREDGGSPREVVVVDRSGPRVVSATGSGTVQATSTGQSSDGRVGFHVWLPPNDPAKAPEFEYRMQIRPQSLALTAYNVGARAPMTPEDAYASLGAFVSPHRTLLRLLARLHPRGSRNPT